MIHAGANNGESCQYYCCICIHNSGFEEYAPPIITSLSVWITEQICMSHKLGASSLITSRCWLIKLFYFLSYSCCWQWRHHWCTWPQGLCVVFLQLGYPPCSSYHLTLSQMTVQFRGSVSMLFAHCTNLTHPDMRKKCSYGLLKYTTQTLDVKIPFFSWVSVYLIMLFVI